MPSARRQAGVEKAKSTTQLCLGSICFATTSVQATEHSAFFSFSFSFHTDEAGALRGARPFTYGAREQDWTWTHWEHCASIEALGDGVSADSTPSPATGFSLTTMGR
jgi:hypothetical protein